MEYDADALTLSYLIGYLHYFLVYSQQEKLLILRITSAQALDVFVGQRCVQLCHVLCRDRERKDLSALEATE